MDAQSVERQGLNIMKKVKKFGFGGALKAAGSAVKKAAAQSKSVPMGVGLAKAAGVKPGTTVNAPAFINKSPLPQAPVGGSKLGASDAQAALSKINAAKQAPYQLSTQKQMQEAAMKQQPNQKAPLAGKNIGDIRKIGTGLGAFAKKPGMKAGGEVKHSDVKMDKKVVKKAVGMHEKQLHGGKKSDMSKLKSGGMACAPKKMAKGGGIEVRGKTKGTMVKMKRGGSC
jgi:hypothetical protein